MSSNIMSTLLMCQYDSTVTKVCGSIVPLVQETYPAETNWANVEITKTICCSLVLIVAICVLGFLIWKQIDHHAQKNVDVRKRRWEEEDMNRKQKSDLIDKRLTKLDKEEDKYLSAIEEAINQFAKGH